MSERLRENKWFYTVLSVILAILFWSYVRTVEDPQQSNWMRNIPVELTGSSVLTQQGLMVSELSHEEVDIQIEAPASVQDALSRHHGEFSIVLDVSKCVMGENRVECSVRWPTAVLRENAAIKKMSSQYVTVTVERLYTNTLPVEFILDGKVADGYQTGTAAIEPQSIVISGTVEDVSRVHRVAAILHNDNLEERYAGDLPLTLLDSDGNELEDLSLTMSSKSAYVVVPVVISKEIPLSVHVIPGGGATEENAKIKISPKTIMVSGARGDIESLTELSLGSVDLSKVVGSSVFNFPITVDPSLENVSGTTTASVSVTVEGLSTRRVDVSNIVLENIPRGYKATSPTKTRTIVLRGDQEALVRIDVSQIRVVADLANMTAVGSYPVPVKVYLDAGGDVGVIGEYTIVITMSK